MTATDIVDGCIWAHQGVLWSYFFKLFASGVCIIFVSFRWVWSQWICFYNLMLKTMNLLMKDIEQKYWVNCTCFAPVEPFNSWYWKCNSFWSVDAQTNRVRRHIIDEIKPYRKLWRLFEKWLSESNKKMNGIIRILKGEYLNHT